MCAKNNSLQAKVISDSMSDMNDLKKLDRDYFMADWKYEKLKEQIEDFQKNLPDTMDVYVQLASFGSNILMYVDSIGYQNPDMLYFYGTINGNEAQLIQHVSQLNFLLMALPKIESDTEPKRIGFTVGDDE